MACNLLCTGTLTALLPKWRQAGTTRAHPGADDIAEGVIRMITFTDSAVSAVRRFIDSSAKPILGLRIKVDGGGCSGMQYGMQLEENLSVGDEVLEFPGIKVLVDAQSAPLLTGVTVDFIDGLDGTGFKFENPNAAGSCGCGKSFSC